MQTDVIYFGLGALLQHMNEQLLDFPKLQVNCFVRGFFVILIFWFCRNSFLTFAC